MGVSLKERMLIEAGLFINTGRKDGGPGSGNFGHEGRPGQVGGSGAGNGMTAEESAHSTAKLNKELADAVANEKDAEGKYFAAKKIIQSAPVGQSVKVGFNEYRKMFDTDDPQEKCFAIGSRDSAEASLSDVMHLVGYDGWGSEPEFVDHSALMSEARAKVNELREGGKVSGSDEVREHEKGLINASSSQYGEPGEYAIYRTGAISDSGMVFFAVTKEGADTYGSLHEEGTTEQYRARLTNPLVVEGAADGECLKKAYEKLHPGKSLSGEITPETWKRADRENASALSDSGHDAIIFVVNGKPHEVQIPAAGAKEQTSKIASYSTTAWSRSGRSLEGAVYDDLFKREPKDYVRVDGENPHNDGGADSNPVDLYRWPLGASDFTEELEKITGKVYTEEKTLDFSTEMDTIKSRVQCESDGAPEGNQNAAGPHKSNGRYPSDPEKYKGWCDKHKRDPIAAKEFTKALKGVKAADGTTVTKTVDHAAYRMKERKLDPEKVKDILENATSSYPANTKNGEATVFQKGLDRIVLGKNGHIVTVMNPLKED